MEAITREEKIMSGENLTPITRKEMFLAKAAGMDVKTPEPITREEMFLSKISGGGSSGGGGSEMTADQLVEGGYAEINLLTATKLKTYAFYNDFSVVNVNMPKVTSIGNGAFYSCSKLALTSLPAGLTSMGDSAFSGCPNLALTSLPAGLTSIGNSAFSGCTGLTSITFKGTLSSIRNAAFSNCTNLKTINVPWAEGEVSGAPWGATNATINYNYTGG